MKTPQTPNFFERIGISPKDVIVVIFILANTYLLVNGHQALDTRLIQTQNAVVQTVRSCEAATYTADR